MSRTERQRRAVRRVQQQHMQHRTRRRRQRARCENDRCSPFRASVQKGQKGCCATSSFGLVSPQELLGALGETLPPPLRHCLLCFASRHSRLQHDGTAPRVSVGRNCTLVVTLSESLDDEESSEEETEDMEIWLRVSRCSGGFGGEKGASTRKKNPVARCVDK